MRLGYGRELALGPHAILARFAEAFAPCGFRPASFYPCYGLAEATLMVTGPKSGSGATVRAFRDDALAQNIVLPLPDARQRRNQYLSGAQEL